MSGGARRIADVIGRDSWIIRGLRPWYETLMDRLTGGRGIPWNINGVVCRIDPRHRHQMGGVYDAPVAQWLAARVRPGDTLLDVGANVGVYVIQFAHWSRPGGRVIAVEPNPRARALLERQLRMNDLQSRVEIVPAAVAATAGDATLFAADTDGMSRLGTPNPELGGRTTAITVPVVTLDDLCASRGMIPDWLVLDIEGFEIAALSGARRLLTLHRESIGIVVEMHPDAWGVAGTTRTDFENLLSEYRLRPEPLTGQADPLGSHGHVWLRPE